MTWRLELLEGLRIAWDATRANKLRAGLTTLGIVIGIVTVTLMGTAIQGLKRGFNQSVSALGSDTLYLQRLDWFINSHEEWIRQNKRREVTWAQYKDLERQLGSARAVAPMVETSRGVKYRNRSASSVQIVGTTAEMLQTGL